MAGLALVGLDVPGLLSLVGSHSLIGAPAKMVGAFPLVYHYLGGLRHIVSTSLMVVIASTTDCCRTDNSFSLPLIVFWTCLSSRSE